jgi:hypothetical protein
VWRKELEMSDFRGGTMIKVPHSGESPVTRRRLQGSTALHLDALKLPLCLHVV